MRSYNLLIELPYNFFVTVFRLTGYFGANFIDKSPVIRICYADADNLLRLH